MLLELGLKFNFFIVFPADCVSVCFYVCATKINALGLAMRRIILRIEQLMLG